MSHDNVRTDYYRQLFDNAFEPILIVDGQYFVDGNRAALNILGMQQIEELRATHPGQLSPEYQPDGRPSLGKANEIIQNCYDKGYQQFEWLHQRLDGSTFLVEVTLKTIQIDGKALLHTTWRPLDNERRLLSEIQKQNQLLADKNRLINEVKSILHTSNEKQLFDQLNTLEQYKCILDESAIVSKADLAGNITFVNDKFCEVSGFSREELIGKNHRVVRHPDMDSDFFKEMWQTISSKKVFKAIIKNQTKDRKPYYVDSIIMPILDGEENIIEYISVRHDITRIYEQDAIINEQYTDNLTKLPNRVKLMRDISMMY
ncbi:PAS domain S-box-containing protein [Oceanospirillum multiglobuliferum]|uniref:PAS domain-containing protein n=1 Tax=Oceanospirillum multiglobuliferum TaxID=64969 RepID=A0A1T4QPN0_9GAMM|nr:PAS domain-containing protein [Oceanospirillum multiglobuliferum]OPX56482.1 hypothetical protein BTE48_03385 [Oceanospirillum multiglobuliferum]SKA05720.1 PAS domain S-box-containing protein [Oceanospirillum multiglobuliferum]